MRTVCGFERNGCAIRFIVTSLIKPRAQCVFWTGIRDVRARVSLARGEIENFNSTVALIKNRVNILMQRYTPSFL